MPWDVKFGFGAVRCFRVLSNFSFRLQVTPDPRGGMSKGGELIDAASGVADDV